MSETEFEVLGRKFFQLEENLNLLKKKIGGVFFWERVRFGIHKRLAAEIDVSERSAGDATTYQEYLDGVRLLLRNLFVRNPYFAPETELLFYGKGRRKQLDDGRWWDIYIDPILETIEETQVCLERPYNVGHATPARTDELRYTDFIQYTGTLLEKLGISTVSLAAGERSLLRQITSEIRARFGVEIPVEQLVREELSQRRARLPLYRRLVRRINPKIAFLTASYSGRETFVEACQSENIPVVELQHGVISKYHLAYSFPGDDKHVFPDYFFSFGEFWSDMVDLPLPDENVFPVGYPYLEKRKTEYEQLETTDQVLVVSQVRVGERLSQFALDLANATERDVVYKLHPKEMDGWRERYPQLQDSSVTIATGDTPLYELLTTSSIQVGVNSTVLFEGLQFGLETYVVDEPGREYMNYLIEQGNATLIDSPDEFISAVTTEHNQQSADPSYFFEQDAAANFERAVTTVARRQGRDKVL
jgi:hypothetical protein